MSRPAPTNRTAARLRVIHGRLTATAAEILDSQPEHELDLGLERYLTPAELLADLDVVDRSLRVVRQWCAR